MNVRQYDRRTVLKSSLAALSAMSASASLGNSAAPGAPPKTSFPELDGFRGRLITAGQADYDSARAVWNGAIHRRPRLIARCMGTGDVLAADVVNRLVVIGEAVGLHQVDAGEELVGRVDPAQVLAGDAQELRQPRAGGHQSQYQRRGCDRPPPRPGAEMGCQDCRTGRPQPWT